MFKHKIISTTSGLRRLVVSVVCYLELVYSVTAIFPAPRAVSLGFTPKTVENVTFLADLSGLGADEGQQIEQQYFDALLQMIAQAESLIVLDMFLFNAWHGPVSETYRALSDELTDALIKQNNLNHPVPTVIWLCSLAGWRLVPLPTILVSSGRTRPDERIQQRTSNLQTNRCG